MGEGFLTTAAAGGGAKSASYWSSGSKTKIPRHNFHDSVDGEAETLPLIDPTVLEKHMKNTSECRQWWENINDN